MVAIRSFVLISILPLLFVGSLMAKARPASAAPNNFEIGRRIFFDFGPPFEFYEVILVRQMTSGASVERISLTPRGGSCANPAEVSDVKVRSASLSKPYWKGRILVPFPRRSFIGS